MDVISNFAARFERTREEELSLEEYLAECKRNPLAYATAAERMLKAIGEPEMVDTRNDPRLSRIFANKVIKHLSRLRASSTAWKTRSSRSSRYFRHAAQGLEEKKQILYLLGPVGGGKISIAERLKQLMEQVPFYAHQGLAGQRVAARPVRRRRGRRRCSKRSTASRAATCNRIMSPVGGQAPARSSAATSASSASSSATRRVLQADRRSPRPSRATRTTRTSRRWSARSTSASSRPIAQDDPDAYSYSGGLCLANQGLLEFVEMFKAPIKVLHPLLTATQEGNFKGTEGFGAIPFDGIVLAHSQRERSGRLPQQQEQRGVPRPHLHRQGAVLPARVAKRSRSTRSCCATRRWPRRRARPARSKMMAQFAVLTRLKEPENSQHLLEDADLRRREPEGHRPEGQDATRNTATTPASTKA